ncbi:MAG TPA: Gfo/Idh/MocA family oxidoreductase, partial [Candidatus Glassbacteria bacterium]|nr:Gfo/Idh/MocA family oxidoreductase [Candidatus Glassbacteria bacterium]
MPEPLLAGRDEKKLKSLAGQTGTEKYTTDLDAALGDPDYPVYFDASTTQQRVEGVSRAIEAGKAVYCEKPSADNLADALDLYRRAKAKGIKNGVVQNKLWLPGLVKLRHLVDSGFFGRLLSVRAEFGYWVFDGRTNKCQRPSWNYRKEDGGGIIVDMLCHWRYVIDNLFGNVRSITCLGATHIPSRIDERGREYECSAEDAAYATFITDSGVVCHFNSSWVVRIRRDDLLTIQVEGTEGSAVAGLHDCYCQSLADTPFVTWNPDLAKKTDYFSQWQPVWPERKFDNAFKVQWELFLRHVAADEPFRWSLLEGARGLQLAEKGLESWKKRCWLDLEDLGEYEE